jgi:molybdopterin-guanine dinucleotide biosynthesis protein B
VTVGAGKIPPMKIFGISGYSGSGKTTLIERLVPLFTAGGLRVSLIKHAHHSFDIDHPGKDTYRHRHAGCTEVMITSSQRWALMHELRNEPEPTLQDAIKLISPCDLLLIEGYKREPIPKLEVYRSTVGEPLMFPQDSHVVAIASDQSVDTQLPQFSIDDVTAIAAFIRQHVGLA